MDCMGNLVPLNPTKLLVVHPSAGGVGPQPLPPLRRTFMRHASAFMPSLCAAVLEVWDRSRCLHELHVPKSLHGGIFNDGWFGTGVCCMHACRCAVALQRRACDLVHAVVVTQCSSASTLSAHHHCAPNHGLPTQARHGPLTRRGWPMWPRRRLPPRHLSGAAPQRGQMARSQRERQRPRVGAAWASGRPIGANCSRVSPCNQRMRQAGVVFAEFGTAEPCCMPPLLSMCCHAHELVQPAIALHLRPPLPSLPPSLQARIRPPCLCWTARLARCSMWRGCQMTPAAASRSGHPMVRGVLPAGGGFGVAVQCSWTPGAVRTWFASTAA